MPLLLVPIGVNSRPMAEHWIGELSAFFSLILWLQPSCILPSWRWEGCVGHRDLSFCYQATSLRRKLEYRERDTFLRHRNPGPERRIADIAHWIRKSNFAFLAWIFVFKGSGSTHYFPWSCLKHLQWITVLFHVPLKGFGKDMISQHIPVRYEFYWEIPRIRSSNKIRTQTICAMHF